MCIKTYKCAKCGTEQTFDVPMSAPTADQHQLLRFCGPCKKNSIFERVYTPTAFSFGMMTARYGGQVAGVSGWGTHTLDYGKNGSDLVTGRAQEAAQRIQPAVVE